MMPLPSETILQYRASDAVRTKSFTFDHCKVIYPAVFVASDSCRIPSLICSNALRQKLQLFMGIFMLLFSYRESISSKR